MKDPGKLNILCVADHVDPVVYSSHAKKRFAHIDLVLSAGDLHMGYLGFIASILNKPVLFVFGNHNLRYMERFVNRQEGLRGWNSTEGFATNFFGSTYVGGRVQNCKGLLIAGLGGSRRYNDGGNQYNDFQMHVKAIKLIPRLLYNRIRHGRYLDILLTHAPPFGINDGSDLPHIGFRTFLWFMKLFKPQFLLHGHVHLYDLNTEREARYGATRVINVYDHYVLEFPGAVKPSRDSQPQEEAVNGD